MKEESLYEYIKYDLARITKPTVKNFLKTYFFTRGGVFRYTVWLRLVQWTKKRGFRRIIYPFVYLIFRHYTYKYGVHIDTNIKIGRGLSIVHGDGVYINCQYVGENFTIYQNVTIGTGHGGKPIIGNNVTVYPNAVVSGEIILHDGCIVGANAFVNKNVDQKRIVAGVPAKVIK